MLIEIIITRAVAKKLYKNKLVAKKPHLHKRLENANKSSIKCK